MANSFFWKSFEIDMILLSLSADDLFFFDECKMVEMRRHAFLCKSNPTPVHNVTTFFTPELAREIGLDNARLLHDAVSIPAWSIDWVLNTCAQNNEVLSRRQRRIKGPDDDNSCDLFVEHEELFYQTASCVVRNRLL